MKLVTGVVGAMQQSDLATLMCDVANGRWLRNAHANGASLFFVVVYVHTVRGFYYSIWKPSNELIWVLGLVILLLMILIGSLILLPLWLMHLHRLLQPLFTNGLYTFTRMLGR